MRRKNVIASKDDNKLKALINHGDQDEAAELGATHLLSNPPAAPAPKEPIEAEELRKAAFNGDMAKLGEHDVRLKQLLQSDDLTEPQAAAALKLYREGWTQKNCAGGEGRSI